MDSIADAIVYAMAHIHCRAEGEDSVEEKDDDSAKWIKSYSIRIYTLCF
jgi:hypothetical protein